MFGNSGGESDHSHVDFTIFEIDYSGPDTGPKQARATQLLDDRCDDFDSGFDWEFSISLDARFAMSGGGMPGSPEWIAWDLASGKKIAAIHPDGLGAVSSDGSTFAVVHDLQRDDSRSKQMMTVRRRGRQRTFALPPSMQADHWRPIVLSSNGQWIALQLAETVVVWSATDGRVVKEYQIGRPAIMLRVSDQGDPLLVDDKNGAAFANGKWRAVRTVEHGLIAPLTPNFHAQCGAIFCDRVVAELGVVERQSRDDRARNAARLDLSPDGRFMIVRTVDKADNVSHDVIDIADGHVVLHDQTGNFASDGRSLVVRENDENGDAGFVKYDLPTGKRIWTATPNRAEDGFYMIFPDGRVRFSAGRSVDLVLVRGFEVRYFDATAVKQFVVPPDADEAR